MNYPKKNSLLNDDTTVCESVCESTSSLCAHVEKILATYFINLAGHAPRDLYALVLEQVEVPLLRKVMEYVSSNQSKAATILGISRGTLRKKLKQYQLLRGK